MKKIWVLLILVILISKSGFSQDSIVDQDVKVNRQIWVDYNFNSKFNDKHTFSTQLGFRKITPEIYDRILAISTLNIDNSKRLINKNREKPYIKSFHLGTGLIYTQNYENNDNFELRFIQGIKFEIPTIKPVTLNNYLRLEERFQNSFNNSGWKSGYRLRYRVSTEISWSKHYMSFTKGVYFPLEAEFFFNLKKTDRFNDLIRLSPGIGYKFNNNWKIETYFMLNRTKNITETNNKSSDYILRIRVYNGGSSKKQSENSNQSQN